MRRVRGARRGDGDDDEGAAAAGAGLLVGTVRGSVHTLSLDRASGALVELCHTQPSADDD